MGLSNLSGVYGITYWKTVFLLTACAREELKEEYADLAVQLSKQIASMNVALEQVCNELGVDISAIRLYAECKNDLATFCDEPEPRFIEQYIELYRKAANFE